MVNIAIVYHSGYGHTEVQAQHVLEGASSVDGVTASLHKVEDLTNDTSALDDMDGMIFGSPTYMGSASAPFKAFMDATAGTWMAQKWKDKVAGGFTNSHSLSGDKLNTLMQMIIFSMQHSMVWVGLGETNHSPDGEPGKADVVNRIGSFAGAMAQSENDSPEVTPPSGDLETARLLGIRIATMTKKLRG